MKLCHNGRCSGSQKVRMVLAEKNLPFESRIMDLQKGDQFDSASVKLNPAALVPTLEDQGRIYIESTLIIEYVDDAYPEPALTPADPDAARRPELQRPTRSPQYTDNYTNKQGVPDEKNNTVRPRHAQRAWQQ